MGNGLVAINRSNPIMFIDGDSAANNITYNGPEPEPEPPSYETAEILVISLSNPDLDYGHNDIYDDGGFYIYILDEDERPIYARFNYWGSPEGPPPNAFFPLGSVVYIPWDGDPNTGSGGNPISGAQGSYQEAVSLEMSGNYEEAISLYEDVIVNYNDSSQALASMGRIFACNQEISGNFDSLRTYYEYLADGSDNQDFIKTAYNFATRCLVEVEMYSEAIAEYEEIILNPPSLEDSVYAVIDAGGVYLLAGSDSSGSGLGKVGYSLGTIMELRPVSEIAHQQKTDELLGLLLNLVTKGSHIYTHIPSEYSLSQNFPNPFNPMTTIKYDIPELSDVQLIVYDLMGREVVTLVNKQVKGGTYQAIWDGKDQDGKPVSSGVYIYLLKARSKESNRLFTQTNKLVLLK